MVQRMYTVYDKVAEEAGPMWTAKNDGVAARQFRGLLESQAVMTPDEYKLLYLGDWDSSTCIASFQVSPVEVVVATHRDESLAQLRPALSLQRE